MLAAAAALAIGLGYATDRLGDAGPSAGADPAAVRPGYGPATFREALLDADRNVATARDDAERVPTDWFRREVLARALIRRWRLSGDYADLAEAERQLDRGLSLAPDPAGPVLSRALLAVTVHRLEQAEGLLARQARAVAPDPAETADAAALAGDIAVQRGELAGADRLFRRADAIAPGAGGGLRRAMTAAYRGDLVHAERLLDAAIAKPRQQPSALAQLMLQRANLAYRRGDWVEAGRWVGAAQRTFPGHWLADAYAAQQFALAGRTAEAIEAYRRVVHRSGRPEAMDALAHVLRLQGDAVASRALAQRARREWAARAALFPEAVAQHRAEHELAVGSADQALTLAQADVAARPQGPGIALLARALILSSRPREALAWLDRAKRQGWVGSNLSMLEGEAHAALGNAAAAETARQRALALNPRAADPRARLIWFGHD